MKAKSQILVVTWRSGNAAGYSDIIPVAALAERLHDERLVHLVRGPRHWEGVATCSVVKRRSGADLDYNPFPQENTSAGMELGVMRLMFENDDVSELPRIQWRDGKNGKWTRADVSRRYTAEVPMPKYNPKDGNRRRRLREVTERPGQARFRAELMLVYGSRCCISGCAVGAALEGAHIDPYQNPTQDSPQNGLLLRRDLHALFDANLLGISPDDGRVRISSALMTARDYALFHGRLVNRPAPGFASGAPDTEALKRRFKLVRS